MYLTVNDKALDNRPVHWISKLMSGDRPYLLLVDDDPDDRDLFAAEFETANPTVPVKYASSGQEALKMLEESPSSTLPAVLLIDYQMPGLNGLGLLQILQKTPKFNGITKIMWSSSQRVKDMEDCKKFGASHYLVKPATNAELHKVVHQLTAVFDYLSRERN